MSKKRALIRYLEVSDTLEDIAKKYPLAVARLWSPFCHRWDGLASNSKRSRGCGRMMTRLENGVYRCEHCQITEQRTSQRDAIVRALQTSEAFLLSGGNRSGKTESASALAVAFASGS